MKTIYLLITVSLIFTGCWNKEPQTPIKKAKIITSKNFYDISEFIYKKDQVLYFENQFNEILKINNKETLQKYADFYRKNSSYFINGKLKAQMLEKRKKNLDEIDTSSSHKKLLTKALSSNEKDRIEIYERLAHQGNIFAQRELANIYKYEKKLKSIFWYKKLIQNNDIESIKDFAFANLHMVRPVVVQDTQKAIKLYEKLDSLGEVTGLVHLGNIYEYGYFKNDVPVDKQKALGYFKKAASKNYTPAQKKLVKIYLCEKCNDNRYNKEEGIKLLNILASKGDEDSKKILENLSSKNSEDEKLIPPKEEVIQEEQKHSEETEESEK